MATELDSIYGRLKDAELLINKSCKTAGNRTIDDLILAGRLIKDAVTGVLDLKASGRIDPGEPEIELFEGFTEHDIYVKVRAVTSRPDVKIISVSHSFHRGGLTVMVAYRVVK